MCYVKFLNNEIPLQLSVDSGASHNFLKKDLESELGISIGSYIMSAKAVNSNGKVAIGVAKEVHLHLDKWKGCKAFTVVQMNDFQVILGKVFLRIM